MKETLYLEKINKLIEEQKALEKEKLKLNISFHIKQIQIGNYKKIINNEKILKLLSNI